MALRMMNLDDLKSGAEVIFGGKACGLARLIAAGARVPAGFAVEATTTPPAQWKEEDRDEFRRRVTQLLRSGPLAVRSSAVGEDAAERSFAGMFETVLNVSDAASALDAAARCIGSARNPRVDAYADGALLPVGLVVQTQLDACAAGVCFTVDPSGKDGAVLIEAVAGIGDRLVSGRAEPDRWRVYRSGLGRWEVRRDGQGNSSQALTDDAAARIAEQATRHGGTLGCPLDLEWAVDRAGDLWWLQARPITAARPAPRFHVQRAFDGADDGPVTVWANFNVRETMPDPLMPLTWSFWRDVMHAMITDLIFGTPRSSPLFPHLLCLDLIHGRVYFNMNGILAWPVVGTLLSPRMLKLIDAEAAEVCGDLMAKGVLRPRQLPGSTTRLVLSTLRANLVALRRFAVALRPRRAMAALQTCEAAMVRRRREHPLSSLSDGALLEEIRLADSPDLAPLRNGLHCEALAVFTYQLAMRAFRHYPAAAGRLTTGIPGNPTTQISIGIDALVDAARPLAPVFREPLSTRELIERLSTRPDGRVWVQQFNGFLARFGHRGPKEFDLGAIRWVEDPGMIIELVRVGLESAPAERVPDRLARLANERRDAVAAAVGAAPWWWRPILRGFARLVELYMPLREAPKHYAMFAFQRMREAALEVGARLATDGHIAARDDVFFLELPEIERLVDGGRSAADVRPLVAERRARFEQFRAQRAPNYLRSDGVPVTDQAAPANGTADGVLHGTGTSAGRASGPVRILTEPDPRAMAEGDVIVMEFADPGWTPLFPRAAGVVMEVGGLMCHAAVVARELGIPAVFGVGGATRVLRNGQPVTVDGTQGTVTPLTGE
jgi:pyruvate,water dikinase